MKNFLCTIGVIACCTFFVNGQQIANTDFENWSFQTFTEPEIYLTSNMFGAGGIGNVTRTTDAQHGTYAARLETVVSGSDTVQGMMIIGTPGNQTIDGGLPFNETPDSISGYAKFDIAPTDTAFFIVAFKQNGTFISQAVTIFVGTQPAYTRFCFPTYLSALNPPDSIVAIITSSRMDLPHIPGSVLIIDSISFLTSVQEFPNGDFENWIDFNTGEDPDGWGSYANQFPFYNLPVQVTKTSDANGGLYAVRITSDTATVPYPFGTGLPGDTLLGVLQLNMINGFSSTALPFAFRPDSLVGYVKGTVAAVPNNSNVIWIQLTKNANVVGQGIFSMPASLTDYTRFATAFTYSAPDVPDSIAYYIFGGNPGNPIPGNIFYVDDLSFVYNPVTAGIRDAGKIYAYPNPAANEFNIATGGEPIQSIVIYNASGIVVAEMNPDSSKETIDISGLPSGIYLYKVNGVSTGRFVKK